MPPFVSWIFAAWTRIHRRFPIVSVTMCRFLPFVFSPVISVIFSVTRCFYALWIDQCVTRFFIPSCLFSCYSDKMFHHFVPYAVISCSAIKTPYSIMRRIVMRQHSPLAACLYDIQHCLYQWSLMIFAFISGWKEFFDCFPLLICQITFVICCFILFFHVSYYISFSLWTQALKQTATANGAKYHWIFRTARQRSCGLPIGIQWKQTNLQTEQ